MSVRISATTIFCIVSLFGVSSALHAQTVGADRIYAAEAKAAALKAQNEQLKQSITTQSSALKRLDDEINLLRQNQESQVKNLRSTYDAELKTLRNNSSAQNMALRDANAALREQVIRLQEQSSQQAQNEATLDQQASGAKAEAANLQDLVNEQGARIENLLAQMNELQASYSAQQNLAQEAPELRKQFAKAVEDNKALRLQLARSEGERVQLKEGEARQQAAAEENERLRAQLGFMQERNTTLQEALSMAPPTEQLQALQTALNDAQSRLDANNASVQNSLNQASAVRNALDQANAQIQQNEQERKALQTALNDAQSRLDANNASVQNSLNEASAMRSALDQAKAQIQQNTQERKALQLQLAQQQARTSDDSSQLQMEHTALQAEYNQLVDGIRNCEARLLEAEQTAAKPAQASSHPEDIRRIAELESALDRANIEIRNANRAFEDEIKLERAMAAGSEVELEQQYQKRINAMQEKLQNCRAG